ncbi:MAG: phytanoyl-CoA dioxygenase family protein [Burkholderiaceae bacterium]
MPKILTPTQLSQFERDGYAFPFTALQQEQAIDYRQRIEAYEQSVGHDANHTLKIKGHLAFPWLMEIATHPAVLDAVEDVMGPDILLFGSSIFAKDAQDPRFVSWHQDSAYFGLTPHKEVTAWVALTEASSAHGCLRVAPGSHLGPALKHVETFEADNMLAKGQTLTEISESQAVEMPLSIGQFSLHHEQTAHSSLPNRTNERRIGFAFFYIPPDVRSVSGRGRATLVRGKDKFGNWDPDDLPRFDLDPLSMQQLSSVWGTYKDGETIQASEIKSSQANG